MKRRDFGGSWGVLVVVVSKEVLEMVKLGRCCGFNFDWFLLPFFQFDGYSGGEMTDVGKLIIILRIISDLFGYF